ncbi:MAG: hypothetical protein LUE86_01495 [Clostridiales bacterium]|nr:hypothetical protein [Clostridiales bacterium]
MGYVIHGASDFGYALTAAVRMWRRAPEYPALAALDTAFATLMPYIDNTTILCAVRDMQPDSVETRYRDQEDKEEPKKFVRLRDMLIAEYVGRNLAGVGESCMMDQMLVGLAREMRCISYYDSNHGCFKTSEEFLAWTDKTCKPHKWELPLTDDIPIEEDILPYFNRICLDMVRYSVGRRTCMPEKTARFVADNIDLIDTETAKAMLDAITEDTDPDWDYAKKMLNEKLLQKERKIR